MGDGGGYGGKANGALLLKWGVQVCKTVRTKKGARVCVCVHELDG